MGLGKNDEDHIDLAKDKQVNYRRTEGANESIVGYFGHMARRNGENRENHILFGKVPGSRGRGRSPTR